MGRSKTHERAADLLVRCVFGERRRPRPMTVVVAQAAYLALIDADPDHAEWRTTYLEASSLLMSGWRPEIEDISRATRLNP